MVLNIETSGGKCPVVRADGSKWAWERGAASASPGVRGVSGERATMETLAWEPSCRKGGQRDTGRDGGGRVSSASMFVRAGP